MMNNSSRTRNSIKNSTWGLIVQVVILFINFIVRKIFIYFLGIEYLGINGLFVNLLTMLSFAELGIGTAIVYSMYKPIAQNDNEKIKSLMKLYKKSYKIIGAVIAILGIIILPFLQYIIKDNSNIKDLNIIYTLFLFNTVMSYFYVYKKSLLIADQRSYICNKINMYFSIIKGICQIFILYFTRSYIFYMIIQVILTILENVVISFVADKLYPFLKEKEIVKLKKSELNDIFKNIKSLVVYKFGHIVLDGTDNIIISSFLGIQYVGILSNYTMIIYAISSLLSQLINSLTASVGNLVATESKARQEDVFNNITFLTFILYGISSICIYALINPFIRLWLGSEFLLSNYITLVLVSNYYINGILSASWIYRGTKGLFVYGKYRPLISAIINIVLSIILLKYIGLLGVLLGTLITRVITNLWFDPWIIYKFGFQKSVWRYYKKIVVYTLITFIIGLISFQITNYINIVSYIQWLMTAILCMIICGLTIYVIFRNTNEFKYYKLVLKNVIGEKNG